jgi:hypothetical protein
MRKVLLAALVALLAPAAAHAQYQLGLRLGYGSAMGDAFQIKGASEAFKMSESLKAQVPLQLDASYKINKDISAGLYVAYGFGQTSDEACKKASPAGSDCATSGTTLGVGAQGFYTFNQVTGPFVPWAGLALGWEQASLKIGGDSATLSGFQGALQVGGDYKVNEQFSVGPYLSYAYGQYSSVSLPAGAPDTESKSHSWLGVGVAGKFNL